jgi:type II secretory pathway component GspD/PulD (secretin)
VSVCLAAAATLLAAEPTASDLYRQARKAERAGQVVQAYLLYSEAAAKDPSHPEYSARAQALQIRAALKAHAMPATDSTGKTTLVPPEAKEATETEAPPGLSAAVSEEDLTELRRMRPPPELKPSAGTKTLDLNGNSKALFEQATAAFGLGVAFDPDFEPGSTRRLHLDNVDYRQALRAVEAATGSFVFPIGQHLIMAAKDTQQKRVALEPTIAVTVPIPDALSPQDAQEVGRAVQQALDIAKLSIDPDRRMVVVRDRISKVRPAQALFEQLSHGRAQVMIEMQFLEVDRSSLLSYGFLLPFKFPITFIGGQALASQVTDPVQKALLAALGTAIPLAKVANLNPIMFGVGIANAGLFGTMTRSSSKTLLDTSVRALDGSTADFHVGSKYPILTGQLLGGTSTAATGTTPATQLSTVPSFNFEDLGLVLKVTPHVHGTEEVSLEVTAEFKVLSGRSANGIPVIATRKLESRVRVRDGEWAVVAGLMSLSDAKSITGAPLLSRIPGIGNALSDNERSRIGTDVIIMLRPVLLDAPPDPGLTRQLWLGSETRLEIPL